MLSVNFRYQSRPVVQFRSLSPPGEICPVVQFTSAADTKSVQLQCGASPAIPLRQAGPMVNADEGWMITGLAASSRTHRSRIMEWHLMGSQNGRSQVHPAVAATVEAHGPATLPNAGQHRTIDGRSADGPDRGGQGQDRCLDESRRGMHCRQSPARALIRRRKSPRKPHLPQGKGLVCSGSSAARNSCNRT